MAVTLNRLNKVAKDIEQHARLSDTGEATQNLHRLAVLVVEIRRKAQKTNGVADKRCQAYNKATLL